MCPRGRSGRCLFCIPSSLDPCLVILADICSSTARGWTETPFLSPEVASSTWIPQEARNPNGTLPRPREKQMESEMFSDTNAFFNSLTPIEVINSILTHPTWREYPGPPGSKAQSPELPHLRCQSRSWAAVARASHFDPV